MGRNSFNHGDNESVSILVLMDEGLQSTHNYHIKRQSKIKEYQSLF